jgi:hypothetical protein
MIDTAAFVSDAELGKAFDAQGLRHVADLAVTSYLASRAGDRVVSVLQVAPGEFVRTMADGTSYHGFYDGFNTGGPRIRWTQMPNVLEVPEQAG